MKTTRASYWLVGLLVVGGWAVGAWAEGEEEAASSPQMDETAASPQEPADAEPAAPQTPGLVSIDFKDADIRQVLRVIALKSGVDIVAGSDVEGLVTIKLTNVPWEQALDIILRTYGFTYDRQDKIVRVMTLDALEQEALATQVFPLDYAKAKEVPDVIQEMLTERGKVKFDERTNTIIVTDVPTSLFQISEVIKRLDQRTPQVLIESKIVETRLEKEENLGIEWSNAFSLLQQATSLPSTFPFKATGTLGEIGDTFVSTPQARAGASISSLSALPSSTRGSLGIGTLSTTDLQITLNLLKERTETKVLSNPTLAVLNNQQAKIHIGSEYPVPTFSVDPSTGKTTVSGFQTRTTGTVLTVTPHVNPSDEIVVDLKPEIVTVESPVTFGVGGTETVELPRFGTQTVQTQVRIRDGETIAIGGLVKESKIVQTKKVPLLGDIPLIGLLFRSRSETDGASGPTLRQDLLIFLTVTLSKEPPKQAVASTPTAN